MSYIGTNKVGKMYLGSTAIGKAYLGEDLVYSSTPAMPKTATPVISYIENADNVVITATGDGTITLMIDGTVVQNPHTIIKTASASSVTATATAQESGKQISDTATQIIQIPAVEYIGDWQNGYNLGNTGNSFVQNSAYTLTPYYIISPKDKIRYDTGSTSSYAVISELPDNFTGISQSVDWWSQTTRPKTITTGSSTHYVIFSIPKANLDVAYIYNVTKGKYLYNGAVDNPLPD